jgi:hypothetical protein
MTKKEQLYYLLEAYAKGEYEVQTFCHAFEEVFFPDIPADELTTYELEVFEELGEKVARFSPFEEDLKKYPKTYFSSIAIDQAITESRVKLAKY